MGNLTLQLLIRYLSVPKVLKYFSVDSVYTSADHYVFT